MAISWTIIHFKREFTNPIESHRRTLSKAFTPLSVQTNADLFTRAWKPTAKFWDYAVALQMGREDFNSLPLYHGDGNLPTEYRILRGWGWEGYYRVTMQGMPLLFLVFLR